MSALPAWRLWLLRAMYLLMALGLALTIWPLLLSPHPGRADSGTVVWSLLGALALVSALGVRWPLRLLPVLVFELAWKLIWVITFGLPAWQQGGMTPYASETLYNCLLGVVLLPLVLPWGYLWRQYVHRPLAQGDSKPS